MKTILSTKRLSPSQKGLLLNAGVSLVEYNAITIEFVPFEVPKIIENAIFTSQNAVNAVMSYELGVKSCFCVGEKTKSLLEEKGQKVVKNGEYASKLADFIVKNHKNEHFYFFCGNMRSDEIPSKLKENKVSFEEIEVYKTTLNPKKFERQFDAILFFSPSGVRSYYQGNPDLQGVVDEGDLLVGLPPFAICIGNTTASEAKKYTQNVVIANATTMESVIAKAVTTLKKI